MSWGHRGLVAALGAAFVLLSGASPSIALVDDGLDTGVFGSCATIDAGVRCWGDSAQSWAVGEPGPPIDGFFRVPDGRVQSLTVQGGSGCAVVDGGVRCWGSASPDESTLVATPVPGLPPVQTVDLAEGIFACARGEDVWCWTARTGATSNTKGELGTGDTAPHFSPTKVVALGKASAVTTGNGFACAIVGGEVWCWGTNEYGQLGTGVSDANPHPTPARVPNVSGVVSIDAGTYDVCAIRADDSVVCWGRNLGTATRAPRVVGGLTAAADVDVGNAYACARSRSSTTPVRCWGYNSGDVLGLGAAGTAIDYTADARDVVGLPSGITGISTGWRVTCARTVSDIWCWGGVSNYPAIGDGSRTSLTPAKVKFPNEFEPRAVDLTTPGPLTRIGTSGQLACSVTHSVLSPPPIKEASPARCGTYFAATSILGSRTWTGPLGSTPDKRWRLVRSETSGDGSVLSPRTATVVSRNSLVELTETTRYIDGDEYATTTVSLRHLLASRRTYQLAHAAECDLPEGTTALAAFGLATCAAVPAGTVRLTSEDVDARGFATTAQTFESAIVSGGGLPGTQGPVVDSPTIGISWGIALEAAGTDGDRTERTFRTRISAEHGPGVLLDTGPPLRRMAMSPDLRCGRGIGTFDAPPWAPIRGCGLWISSGGELFGPDTSRMDAGWPAVTAWTPVAQRTGGSGTAADPWQITTIALGKRLLITQTDRYVDGEDQVLTTVAVRNLGAEPISPQVYAGIDCDHPDPRTNTLTSTGYGYRDAMVSAVDGAGCSTTPKYDGDTVALLPEGPSSFLAGSMGELASGLERGGALDGRCNCATPVDDGMGLSWELALAPGQTKSVSYRLKSFRSGPEPPDQDPDEPQRTVPWNMVAIGMPAVWKGGIPEDGGAGQPESTPPLTGAGQTVAIVDTGVDRSNPWIAPTRSAGEACWTSQLDRRSKALTPPRTALVEGTCALNNIVGVPYPRNPNPDQNGQPDFPPDIDLSITGIAGAGHTAGDGAARPWGGSCQRIALVVCLSLVETNLTFFQGTFVAGLAAGRPPEGVGGVAYDAGLMQANVASWRQRRAVIAAPNDAAKALEWIDSRRGTTAIAAVNLMLPGRVDPTQRGPRSSTACSGVHPYLERAIRSLTRHRIPVVVAAGDDGDKRRLPWPACLADVISVGAYDQGKQPMSGSNASGQLTILAPGRDVVSARMRINTELWQGGDQPDTVTRSGTFAAAAHVTGAIAIYRQRFPGAAASAIKRALVATGEPIAERRTKLVRPGLRVDRLVTYRPTG